MKAHGICVMLAVALATNARADVAERRHVEPARTPARDVDPSLLEAQANETFARLLPFYPVRGPRPELELSPEERVDARADDRATITITRGLLRLCATGAPPPGVSREDVTRTRIAFIIAHELAHIAHGHPGLFGPGVAKAIEQRADEDAVGALLAARFDPERLYLTPLLSRISLARKAVDPGIRKRSLQVATSVATGHRHGEEWRLGWLLSVSGRFDDARTLYRSFASKYPSPSAMYALAQTRVLAAWRLQPCADRDVLRWSVPLRYDPRALLTPFNVRSADDSCEAFRSEVLSAIEDLRKVPVYPPARVAVGALRLMLSDPSLDPTVKDGGATQLGSQCPPQSIDLSEASLLRADACQISLLAQLEMSRNSSGARQTAIDGLRALRERWPAEPSLQYNLARVLAEAGRGAEAAPLWAEFVSHAAPGPYRDEAETQFLLVRPASATVPAKASPPAGLPSPLLSDIRSNACKPPAAGTEISLLPQRGLRQCGSWSDELVVRKGSSVLMRTVSASSRLWAATEPPTAAPLFVSHDATGDVLRVWDGEAWVFTDDAPSRVVYFKRAQ